MRIRKRKVPFPLSSLSPVPLSDLYLTTTSSSIDHLQLLHNNPVHNLPEKDDKTSIFTSNKLINHSPSFGGKDSSDCGGGSQQDETKKVLLQEGDENQKRRELEEEEEEEEEEEREKSHETRRGSFFMGAKTSSMVLQDSFHQADGKYLCEGKRSFPFKKKRGRLEKSTLNEEERVIMEKDKTMKAKSKMKSMKKKCIHQNGNVVDEEDTYNGLDIKETKEEVVGYRNSGSSTRRRASGGALMEGSRCSRVNGRGWRCFQQTLVGYSLCEHHLGKGRLRSMTSVRSRSSMASPKRLGESQLLKQKEEGRKKPYSLDGKPACDPYVKEEEEEEKQPLLNIAKRKQKLIGTLKARSISSLLGQANNEIDHQVAENDRV